MTPAVSEKLPIRTISSLTGVNPITLRAWERRYGLIQPQRTPKGHRFYTQQHVELIQRVLALVERGIPIGQVREALESQPPAAAVVRSTGPWPGWLERMSASIARFDEPAVDAVYEDALSLHPIERVNRLLLLPLLAHLGKRWKEVSGAVAEEHFFAMYLRNKLGARLHYLATRTTGPKLLAACAPGEHHEIGLLLFTIAAHEAGMRVVSLGADMPLAEIAIAARRCGCHAIVISASIDPAPSVIDKDLAALASRSEVPVFFGGAASVAHRRAIVLAGAIPLGTDLEAGVRAITASLGKSRRPS